jgi:cytochrome c oxidase assembly protein subunit 15
MAQSRRIGFQQARSRAARQTSAAARIQALVHWLVAVALLVIAIVVVGGITRLTESGLSITQWQPISGIIPPLGQAQWEASFAHYRQIDQYAAVHAGMTLSQFKGIFFWEYLHRVLGRVIGLAVVVPLLWFAARGAIPRGFGWRLCSLVVLVGLQGTLGWLMVSSGLQPGMTEVAPLWLAAHLLTALFTLTVLIWTALDLRMLARDRAFRPARVTWLGAATGAVLALQLFYGALMAGLRAGHVTNQWPLMNGHVFPGTTETGESLGHALVADPAIVHFIHRWLAWGVLVMLVIMARRLARLQRRLSGIAIHIAIGTQIALGIATVVSGVALWLAVLHQLMGALLVAATANGAHGLGRAKGSR